MTTPTPVPKDHPAIKLLDYRATDHNSFITHIDRSPVYAKIVAFQGPLWINIILGGLLTWRAMKGTSHYYSMVSIFYSEFIMKPNPTPMSWTWTIINGIIDLCLYNLVWPGVRAFITGHLWLRLRWGFKETEIVFRKPTGWRRALLDRLSPEEFQRQYNDVLYRAIDPKLMLENTGYLTRIDYWALEYNAVGDAYALMAAGELDIETWDLSVWTREGGEWHVWEVWRLHDKKSMEVVVGIVMASADC
ncbi:hypothetical protein BD779DRAFT_1680579 [Infundibulicybe gibba]|nr:hypothetical protein BD779DRAFT_1680579 [Infundibulicybe gibba]